MLNKKWLFLISLTAALSLSGPAFAHHHAHETETAIPDGADEDDSFRLLLRAIDIIPDPAAMEARWPDIVPRLAAAAENPELSRYERLRATSFLGNYVQPEARFALIRLTGDAEPRIRGLAYYTLGAAFLNDSDEALLAHLEAGLQDDADRVRADVVRALRFTDHPRAIELLEALASGDDEQLRSIAERSLSRR